MSMLVEKLCVSYFVFYIFWSVDVYTSEIHISMPSVLQKPNPNPFLQKLNLGPPKKNVTPFPHLLLKTGNGQAGQVTEWNRGAVQTRKGYSFV